MLVVRQPAIQAKDTPAYEAALFLRRRPLRWLKNTFVGMKTKLHSAVKDQIGMIYSMWAGIEVQLESLSDEQQKYFAEHLSFSGFGRNTPEADFAEELTCRNGEYDQFEGRASGGNPNSYERNVMLRKVYDRVIEKQLPFTIDDFALLAKNYSSSYTG